MKCLFSGSLLCLLLALTGLHAAERPNVVLIMADDVGWEAFGCYGADDYQTPRLDQMAREGMRFSHCYSTPICTPSRVMIMTGKYSFRNYTHFGYLSPEERTFGHLLKDAGYKTAIAGKWQLNGLYNSLPGHDDMSRPVKAGFDDYSLWQLTHVKDNISERFWSPPIEQNGKFISQEENAGKYGPDLFCDFLCDFIERNQKEPFFAYYPMVLVHSPFVPTPDTIGDLPRDQSANKGKGKAAKKNFVAMVNYMDKITGRIIDKIDSLGIAENTIVIFTADNGTSQKITSSWKGQSIQGGKSTMTNMGTHVPMIVRWKGKTPAGKVLDDPVDFSDIYPTLAEAAGIEIEKEEVIDGVSFLPQLQGKKGNPRDWVFCHYQPYWNKSPGQFIRSTQYKLYRDGKFVEPAADLDETNDLSNKSGDAARENALQQLKSVLDQAPPASTIEKAGKETSTEDRLVYPDWKMLGTP